MKKRILAFVSILLVFSFAFSLAGCSLAGEEETTTTVTAKSPLPTEPTSSYDENRNIVTDTSYSPEDALKNTAEIAEYAFNLMNAFKASPVPAKVEMGQDKSIGKATIINENGEEESVAMSDNAIVNAAIESLKKKMLDNAEEGATLEYADSKKEGAFNEFLPLAGSENVVALTADDLEIATCIDEGESRVITINIKNDDTPSAMEARIAKAYDKEDLDQILAEFDKTSAYLKVATPELTYKNCQIILRIDNQTDQITEIQYIKSIDVKTEVTGEGSMADIGTVPVIFNYTCRTTYKFDYTDPDAPKEL